MALSTDFTLRNMGGEGAHQNVLVLSITFPGDGAYPTGGTAAFTEFIRKKDYRLYGGWRVINVEGWGVIGGVLHFLKFDRVNDTLLVFSGADGTQVTNATDLSATTFNATIWAE